MAKCEYRWTICICVGIILHIIDPANAMNAEEIRNEISRTFQYNRINEEREAFGFASGTVAVWSKDPVVTVVDLTNKSITENIASRLFDPVAYLGLATPIKFQKGDDADVRIILIDGVRNDNKNSTMKLLSQIAGMDAYDAFRLGGDLTESTDCYFKRYFDSQGNFDRGVITVYPAMMVERYKQPEAIIECIYEGLLYVSGFPRSTEIRSRLGSKIGQFDSIALESMYNCVTHDKKGRSVSTLGCVIQGIPDGYYIQE